MKAYWDTSSFLAAAIAGKTPAGHTRAHTLAEAFGNLTGRGVSMSGGAGRVKMVGNEAAEFLRNASAQLAFVELPADLILDRLREAQALDVQGGRVHDYLHICAAEHIGADVIYTANTKDFAPLTAVPLAELPAE